MVFPLDRIVLGPRSYGLRPRTEGVTFHTPENAGPTLQNALSTIGSQSPGGGLYAGGGSYHFYLTDQGPILSVPYLESAGGISGNHTPPPSGFWAPGRYPWLQQKLTPQAYADPNAYMLQIAASGRTSELRNYAAVGRMIDDAARILIWAEMLPEINDDLLVHGHMHWQTDRSDPGQWFLDEVMDRYTTIVGGTVSIPVEPIVSSEEEVLPSARIGVMTLKAGAQPRIGGPNGLATSPLPATSNRTVFAVSVVIGNTAYGRYRRSDGNEMWYTTDMVESGVWLEDWLRTRLTPTGFTQAQVDTRLSTQKSTIKTRVNEAIDSV